MLSQKMIETAIMTAAVGQKNSSSSDAAPSAAEERELRGRARPEAPGERAEQVGDEGRGGQRGQAERLEAAAPGDRRQQRGDQGDAHADADGRDQVEGEIPPDLALGRRWAKRWPEHRVPRSRPAWPAR